MTADNRRFEELAQRLAVRTKELQAKHGVKPRLTVVRSEPKPSGMHDVERDSHCRMIRHMRRRWGQPMQLLIDQACFGLPGIEQLDDRALVGLHRDLERAQDCLREGILFEDAGLIRSTSGGAE